jgi:hypothetical protein
MEVSFSFFSYLIEWLGFRSDSMGERPGGCNVSAMPISG